MSAKNSYVETQRDHKTNSSRDDEELGGSGSGSGSGSGGRGGSIDNNIRYDEDLPLADDPEEEDFVKKYGDINVQYIEPPPSSRWFTKPYALNYFHDGKLFRTKHERGSGKLELFLDLIYVGIAMNLSSNAIKDPSWLSFVKYIFYFIPAWTIWADLKDFMNYYFNDDLLQKFYVVWILALLLIYDNNVEFIFDSRISLLTTVVVYFLARITLGLMLMFYSIFVYEHRIQMRIYSTTLLITSSCWFFILLIHSTVGYIIFTALLLALEQICFIICFHPWLKKKLNLSHSTALNIEHEDERLGAFFIISIGEFMLGIVSNNPLKLGWNTKIAKGLALLIDAFIFLELYSHKDGSIKATHAMRRSVWTAMGYIYIHLPLIASLLIVGDAGADLAKLNEPYEDEKGVIYFFSGGIFIALCTLTIHPLFDKPKDHPHDHMVNRYARIGLRLPIGAIILGLAWTNWKIVTLIWIDTLFLILLFIYELFAMNPKSFYRAGCEQIDRCSM